MQDRFLFSLSVSEYMDLSRGVIPVPVPGYWPKLGTGTGVPGYCILVTGTGTGGPRLTGFHPVNRFLSGYPVFQTKQEL